MTRKQAVSEAIAILSKDTNNEQIVEKWIEEHRGREDSKR